MEGLARIARAPEHLDHAADNTYARGGMATQVRAHIAGTVWKIDVSVGDPVTEGQTVAVLESMKMEMPVEAPSAGKVAKIVAAPGQAVEEGAVLLELE